MEDNLAKAVEIAKELERRNATNQMKFYQPYPINLNFITISVAKDY